MKSVLFAGIHKPVQEMSNTHHEKYRMNVGSSVNSRIQAHLKQLGCKCSEGSEGGKGWGLVTGVEKGKDRLVKWDTDNKEP